MKLLCKTIAASAFATLSIVLGMSGSAVAAPLAIADTMTPITKEPPSTGPYQMGTASNDFLEPDLKEIYTPVLNDKQEYLTKVWEPNVWHPKPAVPEGSSSSKNTVSNDLDRKLLETLNQSVYDRGVTGVTLAIISPQGTWVGASGVSELKAKTPMQPDDIFGLASASKPFIAATVLKVAQQGKLSLDDTLGKWLPDIAAKIPDGGGITIRQILNGTSGITDFAFDKKYQADVFSSPYTKKNQEELVAYIYGKPRFQGLGCTVVLPQHRYGFSWTDC